MAVAYSLNRSRSKFILAGLVLGQLVLLAYQVRKPNAGGVRLVRLWSIEAILPFERATQRVVSDTRGFFSGYVTLHDASVQNQQLRSQIAALELQNHQLAADAREVPILDNLLGFQRALKLKTQAAAVISSGASADAQAIYIDRGSSNGLAGNMAVITPNGLVGKISQVFSEASQVLLLTDPDSGAGALIDSTGGSNGVHGLLRGLGAGRVELRQILKDEPVPIGANVITSGEDQVYPKGIPIGTITSVTPSTDGVFKTAQVKLAADLGRLEDVLVITQTLSPPAETQQGITAADVRESLLPALPSYISSTGQWPQPVPDTPPGITPITAPPASSAKPSGGTPLPPNGSPAKTAPAKTAPGKAVPAKPGPGGH